MPDRKQKTISYYPDTQIFLIILPIISAINYYLTYTNIRLNAFLFLTFTIDTVQGYISWLVVRQFIRYLDVSMPYSYNPPRRIIFQLFSTLIIGLAIISLLTELVSWIARGKAAPLHFYTRDLFIIGIWFFVVNGIYIGLYYYREWQEIDRIRIGNSEDKTDTGILLTHGKQEVLIDYDDLQGIYIEGDFCVARTLDGRTYYPDLSLDQLEKILPENNFFRLNRRYIIHRRLIQGFKRIENGKLLVMLKPQDLFPPEISVSRTKAPAFKRWFRTE